MAKILKILYSIVSGSLPSGLSLNSQTGQITGRVSFDSLNLGPTWSNALGTNLGVFNEQDTITPVTFTATGSTPILFNLASDLDRMPPGLVLNSQTGQLSGTIRSLPQRVKEAGVTFDGPTWNTQFGRVAAFDEGSSSAVTLSASPKSGRTISSFQLISGSLPWGLVLGTSTGQITGTVAELKTPGAFVDVPKLPVPVFNQASGTLTTVNEGEAINLQVTATPDVGRSMIRFIIRSGALPWGLVLNQATGAITGTIGAIIRRNEPAYYDATKNPIFSDTVVVNSVSSTITAGGSLGNYTKGTSVTAQFSATPASGRTIRNYWISSGVLPLGLRLNSATGQISGTILNSTRTRSRTYNFTVSVTDKDGPNFLVNNVSRAFTITVQ